MEALKATMLQLPRLLKPHGSIWIQMPDYHNMDGNMACIPERLVLTLVQDHDWKLKGKRIWYRPTDEILDGEARRYRRDWEYLYWFVKTDDYYWNTYNGEFDREANTSIVTARYTKPEPEVFESGLPEDVVFQSIALTCPEKGTILDPYCGTATVGDLALQMNISFLGIEIRSELIPKINKRLEECLTAIRDPGPSPNVE